MGITREQVWQVADTIVGEGAEPRYLLIRQRLGTGSFGTIAKFLREWRAQGRDGQSPAPDTEMPAPFRDAVLRLGAEVWKIAMAWTQAEIAAARESGRRRIEELSEELAADAEQASSTVDTLQEQLEELRA